MIGFSKMCNTCILTFSENMFISFLDECSTGVDPVARREIWQMVSDLVATEVEGIPRTSVILTTHSMDECEVSRKKELSEGQKLCRSINSWLIQI